MKAAFVAPCALWPVIVAIGAGPAVLAVAVSRDLLAPALVVGMALQIYVFGRIVAQVAPDRPASFRGILRDYGTHYLITAVLVGVLVLVLYFAAVAVVRAPPPDRTAGSVARVLVAALTIHVWPLVFLRRASVTAILAGVVALVRNLAASLWIIGVVLVANAAITAGQAAFVDDRTGVTFAAVLVAGVAHTYLTAVAFTGALHFLLGVKVVRAGEAGAGRAAGAGEG